MQETVSPDGRDPRARPSTSRGRATAISRRRRSAPRRPSSSTRSASGSPEAPGRGWRISWRASLAGARLTRPPSSPAARGSPRRRRPSPTPIRSTTAEFDCVHEGAVVHAMTAVLSGRARPRRATGRRARRGADHRRWPSAWTWPATSARRRGRRSSSSAPAPPAASAPRRPSASSWASTPARWSARWASPTARCAARCRPTPRARSCSGCRSGFNARNALVACDMAARGVPSVENVLEGPFGYYRLFEGEYDAAAIPRGARPDLARHGAVAQAVPERAGHPRDHRRAPRAPTPDRVRRRTTSSGSSRSCPRWCTTS